MNDKKKPKSAEQRKSRGVVKPNVIMPVPSNLSEMPEGYAEFLSGLKERITQERIKAVMSANAALVLMYWDMGSSILERQQNEGWGAKVIDRLSHDLKSAFPDMSGFSPRNLKYMRAFAAAWSSRELVQRTVAQLPWRSNLTLLEKLEDPELRLWYAQKAIENGMGKDMLTIQIETRLHERQGKAITNFPAALPPLVRELSWAEKRGILARCKDELKRNLNFQHSIFTTQTFAIPLHFSVIPAFAGIQAFYAPQLPGNMKMNTRPCGYDGVGSGIEWVELVETGGLGYEF